VPRPAAIVRPPPRSADARLRPRCPARPRPPKTQPWYIAKEKGAFAAAGIDLDYTDYPGGTGAMTKALNENELDVALLLTEGCVKDIACGGSHKIVAVYVQSSLCWGVHTGAGQSDIQATGDLDGKVWAVSRMTSGSHLMAVVLAKQQGWDYTQLKYEIVGNLDGAQEALGSGKANGFLWEKFTTKPLVDSGAFRRVGTRPARALPPAFPLAPLLLLLPAHPTIRAES